MILICPELWHVQEARPKINFTFHLPSPDVFVDHLEPILFMLLAALSLDEVLNLRYNDIARRIGDVVKPLVLSHTGSS
jgi:hypothetical protein